MQISEIKTYMKQNKITYEVLSKKSGVSISTIKDIFRGATYAPRLDTMQAIEQALGLNAPTWSENDRAQGVTDTITRKLTPEDDDIISIYHEIKQKKGANAQALAKKILEQIRDS